MSKYVVKIISTLENECYSNGTGFFCSKQGHIMTCAHNIVHCKEYKIYHNKKLYNARIIAVDNRIDIAILKIDHIYDCPTIAMIVQYGKCYTYGFHHDQVTLSYQEGSLMTLNYVSNHALDSTLTTIKGYQGASGSPIFNEKTEVVGIFSYESTIGSGGVVSRLLQTFWDKVSNSCNYLKIHRSHTGMITHSIGVDEILAKNIESLKTHVKGERVVTCLRKNLPLQVNDIIISVNNNTVGRGYISMESYVLYLKPGSVVKIDFLKHKNNYIQSSCRIKVVDFPKEYDKPLYDTTLLQLRY